MVELLEDDQSPMGNSTSPDEQPDGRLVDASSAPSADVRTGSFPNTGGDANALQSTVLDGGFGTGTSACLDGSKGGIGGKLSGSRYASCLILVGLCGLFQGALNGFTRSDERRGESCCESAGADDVDSDCVDGGIFEGKR